jgi:hypothetical protein
MEKMLEIFSKQILCKSHSLPPQIVQAKKLGGLKKGEQKTTNIHGSITGMRAR